jgi:methylthioribose-1-phosphate isomerase
MNVNGKYYKTIWINENNPKIINIIDQRFLPHKFVIEEIHSLYEMVTAIKDMHLRGAGLIGAAAGYGMYLAAIEFEKDSSISPETLPNKVFIKKKHLIDIPLAAPSPLTYEEGIKLNLDFDVYLKNASNIIISSRPTAVNLEWAVKKQLNAISKGKSYEEKIKIAKETATLIANEDSEFGRQIGINGVELIEKISKKKKGDTVNILTHCNAGWLAFVDYGSALAPVYEAFNRRIKIHVWVDETRPRNQGAGLTAWELLNHGVDHTVIVDNAGGHLMQNGMVDIVIVGGDRVTSTGDTANKIGTYLKALAAYDNEIPFYVAIPSSSIDWAIEDGIKEIIIEERNPEEVQYVQGLYEGEIKKVLITPFKSTVKNYGFDITPARLITGIITEKGICKAEKNEIEKLFPNNH